MSDYATASTAVTRQEINREAYLSRADEFIADGDVPADRAAMISDRADLVAIDGTARSSQMVFKASKATRLAITTQTTDLAYYQADCAVFAAQLDTYNKVLEYNLANPQAVLPVPAMPQAPVRP